MLIKKGESELEKRREENTSEKHDYTGINEGEISHRKLQFSSRHCREQSKKIEPSKGCCTREISFVRLAVLSNDYFTV